MHRARGLRIVQPIACGLLGKVHLLGVAGEVASCSRRKGLEVLFSPELWS